MKYALIELPDDFEKEDCSHCPCSYWEDIMKRDECVFCNNECPLEILDRKPITIFQMPEHMENKL